MAKGKRRAGVCRVCGCTDDRACPGGCCWVEPDLCSACAGRQERASIDAGDPVATWLHQAARAIERELGAPVGAIMLRRRA